MRNKTGLSESRVGEVLFAEVEERGYTSTSGASGGGPAFLGKVPAVILSGTREKVEECSLAAGSGEVHVEGVRRR